MEFLFNLVLRLDGGAHYALHLRGQYAPSKQRLKMHVMIEYDKNEGSDFFLEIKRMISIL